MHKAVSLYIPCYNAEVYIEKCLESVFSQTVLPAEVIVVDDGSIDQTVKKASRFPVKLVRHDKNLGLGAARNTGLNTAVGDLVASIDSDCVLPENWLESLVSHFDGDVCGVSGKVVENSDTVIDRWRSMRMKQHWGDLSCHPDFLFGANTIYLKKAVLASGGYDPQYKTNYEDVDICAKMQKKGCQFVYDPKVLVSHCKKDTLVSLFENYWRWNFHYYAEERQSYSCKEKFKEKMAENAGVSNRFLDEDMQTGATDFVYLDFLLASYLFLQDVLYFYHRKNRVELVLGETRGWEYLMDFALCVRLGKDKERYDSLLKKEYLFEQMFFSCILVQGHLVKRIFDVSVLNKALIRDLMRIFLREEEVSSLIVRMLNQMSWAGFDWRCLYLQSHQNMDQEILCSFFNTVEKFHAGVAIKYKQLSSYLSESITKLLVEENAHANY